MQTNPLSTVHAGLHKLLFNKIYPGLALFLLAQCFAPALPHHHLIVQAQISWSGYFENYNAVTTTGENEWISGRNRIRLNLLIPVQDGRAYLSNDIRNSYSDAPDSVSYTLREAYVELFLNNSDLRIGRQIIVWGHADGAFIADIISPVDFSEFLTQSFEDLRTGVDAITYTRFFGYNNLQFVINPVFNPHTLPPSSGRWDVRPQFAEPLNVTFNQPDKSAIRIRDTQFAARLALRPAVYADVNLAVLYWRPGLPAYRKTVVAEEQNGFRLPVEIVFRDTYRQTFITTLNTNIRLANNFSSLLEAAWFHKKDFDYLPENITFPRISQLLNTNPEELPIEEIIRLAGEIDSITRSLEADSLNGLTRARSFISAMKGFQYTRSDWFASLQYLAEIIPDYNEQIVQDSYYHSASLLLQRTFNRETMTLRLFSRYNFNGDDYWINPEWLYDVRDGINFRLGAHLFGGTEPDAGYGHVHFSNFAANSFVYGGIRLYW